MLFLLSGFLKRKAKAKVVANSVATIKLYVFLRQHIRKFVADF